MALTTEVLDREIARLRAFTGVDPESLDRARLSEVRDAVGAARRALDVLSASVAAEVARRSAPEFGAGGLSRQEGSSSPVKTIARDWGLGLSEAGRLIDVGTSLRPNRQAGSEQVDAGQGLVVKGDGGPGNGGESPTGEPGASPETLDTTAPPGPPYPQLAEALNAGALTAAAAAEITRTLDVAATGAMGTTTPGRPSPMERLERQLVARAQKLSLSDLKRMCRQLRAHKAPQDLEQRERHQRAERFLTFTEDADGMTTVSGRLDPSAAVPLRTWVDAHVRQAFQARRHFPKGADDRTPGQMRADAIADLAKHGLGCEEPTMGVKATVVVRVSHEDLTAGTGVADCDDTSGPISVSALRSLAVDAEVLPVVLGGASVPLDLGRSRRQFTRAQRIALAERDGGCAWCHAPTSYCDAHHVKWWARDGGTSDIDNGVLLCTACHHRIHDTGWEITTTRSRVWLIPPASLDPDRTPILGGRAALTIEMQEETEAPPDKPPREATPAGPDQVPREPSRVDTRADTRTDLRHGRPDASRKSRTDAEHMSRAKRSGPPGRVAGAAKSRST